jgi:hypothetical protein
MECSDCRRWRRGDTGWRSPATAGRREDGREQRLSHHIVSEGQVLRLLPLQDLLLLPNSRWYAVLRWSADMPAPMSPSQATPPDPCSTPRQRRCHASSTGPSRFSWERFRPRVLRVTTCDTVSCVTAWVYVGYNMQQLCYATIMDGNIWIQIQSMFQLRIYWNLRLVWQAVQ